MFVGDRLSQERAVGQLFVKLMGAYAEEQFSFHTFRLQRNLIES